MTKMHKLAVFVYKVFDLTKRSWLCVQPQKQRIHLNWTNNPFPLEFIIPNCMATKYDIYDKTCHEKRFTYKAYFSKYKTVEFIKFFGNMFT
jgi:hypothetical protein